MINGFLTAYMMVVQKISHEVMIYLQVLDISAKQKSSFPKYPLPSKLSILSNYMSKLLI